MDEQEKKQKLSLLYTSKEELEKIVERADSDKVNFFKDQLTAIKEEIKKLEQ